MIFERNDTHIVSCFINDKRSCPIGKFIIVFRIARKGCSYSIRIRINFAVVRIVYGYAVGKVARNVDRLRRAVISKSAADELRLAHIISCLTDSKHCLHIVYCVIVDRIARKDSDYNVLICTYLIVIFIGYGYTVGQIITNGKRVDFAIVGHRFVFKGNRAHIVHSFFDRKNRRHIFGYDVVFRFTSEGCRYVIGISISLAVIDVRNGHFFGKRSANGKATFFSVIRERFIFKRDTRNSCLVNNEFCAHIIWHNIISACICKRSGYRVCVCIYFIIICISHFYASGKIAVNRKRVRFCIVGYSFIRKSNSRYGGFVDNQRCRHILGIFIVARRIGKGSRNGISIGVGFIVTRIRN